MAAVIEVNYFNSFWLKKIADDGSTYPAGSPVYNAIYPGTNNTGYNLYNNQPAYPATAGNAALADDWKYDWYIEESRIRGGYNNTSVDLGVKAYIEEEDIQSERRESALIYSGVFNSRTGINETNQFSTAFDITKSLDPINGSIQKLYAEDTNLICFQERKVSRALIDKDAIYSAEGGGTITSSQQVIGEFIPYVGEFGISRNPESFAKFGFRKYFTDQDRGVVLRLSRDGLTEISAYGMLDYFRDRFQEIPDNKTTVRVESLNNDTTGTPSVSNTFTVDLTAAGVIEIGMLVEWKGIDQGEDVYVIDTNVVGLTVTVTLSKPISLDNAGESIDFYNTFKTKVVGGWDIHNRNYTLSLQDTSSFAPIPTVEYDDTTGKTISYSTLVFDDNINGWVSFYTYKPDFLISIKNTLFSTSSGKIARHYVDIPVNPVTGAYLGNYQVFYNQFYEAAIEFVFNVLPSQVKNFQTVSYEGSNGWEVDFMISGFEGYDNVLTSSGLVPHQQFNDSVEKVKSLEGGRYIDASGRIQYAGFKRKENRYVANLINSSTIRPQEVLGEPQIIIDPTTGIPSMSGGNQISGIKGYFATMKISTDGTTDIKGPKELFAVGTKYVTSS